MSKSFQDIMRAAGNAVGKTMREEPKSAAPPVVVHLDEIELGALDVWIADQADPKPSRPEAVKRLIAEALVRR